MKKLIFLGIGSALVFTMGGVGPATADAGPHISTAMDVNSTANIATQGASRCASCHRTHTAKASMLLKAAQPALCYTCHGGGAGANTDVQNGTSGGTLALRGGGFEYALIGAGEAVKTTTDMGGHGPNHSAVVPKGAAEATTSKHQIDGVTTGTMWGNGAISATANVGKATVTLECGSCHDPHGNGNYRILKPVPNDAGTLVSTVVKAGTPEVLANPSAVPPVVYKAAVPAVMSPGPAGVAIPDVPVGVAKVYTTTDYWNPADRAVPVLKGGAAPAATVVDGYIANVSAWCSTCHTRYLAAAPAYETDSGDAVFMYRHTGNNVSRVGERPNCIQCHVSHGSNAAMTTTSSTGLLPGDTAAPAGDSHLLRIDNRGVCVACHNV